MINKEKLSKIFWFVWGINTGLIIVGIIQISKQIT